MVGRRRGERGSGGVRRKREGEVVGRQRGKKGSGRNEEE